MSLLDFETKTRNELLDYLEYLHSNVTTDLVSTLAEKFQIAYENLSQLSNEKLKEILNHIDGLEIAW